LYTARKSERRLLLVPYAVEYRGALRDRERGEDGKLGATKSEEQSNCSSG
jgi:hypothetical protein